MLPACCDDHPDCLASLLVQLCVDSECMRGRPLRSPALALSAVQQVLRKKAVVCQQTHVPLGVVLLRVCCDFGQPVRPSAGGHSCSRACCWSLLLLMAHAWHGAEGPRCPTCMAWRFPLLWDMVREAMSASVFQHDQYWGRQFCGVICVAYDTSE